MDLPDAAGPGSLLDQLQMRLSLQASASPASHDPRLPPFSPLPARPARPHPLPEIEDVDHDEIPDVDLLSESLFPALPAAAARPVAPSWRPASSSSKPAAAAAPSSSPASSSQAPRLQPTSSSSLSNSITERFEIQYHMQLKQQLGKQSSAFDVCKSIMARNGTSIELSTNKRTGTLAVLVSGKPDAVRASRREIVNALSIQITKQISIPASVRFAVLGKAGATLKAITARTLTSIQIAKSDRSHDHPVDPDSDAIPDPDPEADIPVSITGDAEGVATAQKEIEAIVAKRASRHHVRFRIDRSFHQLIAGPDAANMDALQDQFNVKIHMAPPDIIAASSKDKDLSEIAIVGERASALAAQARLLERYEELKHTTRSIQIPIKKKQHRFIIGPKGSTLREIFAQSGCCVEVPPISDPSEEVLVRGPETMLTVALQLVLERANSVLLDEIPLAAYIPPSLNPHHLLRFIVLRERQLLKSIEAEHSVSLFSQQTHLASSPQQQQPTHTNGPIETQRQIFFELQAKSKESLAAGRNALVALLRDHSRNIFIGAADIPSGLHGVLIGKNGHNVTKLKAKPEWNDRLVDIVTPAENEDSDEVLIVIRREPSLTVLAASDKEATALFESIKKDMLGTVLANADLTSVVLNIEPKFHGRLIGSGGAMLKELLAPYTNAVSLRFSSTAPERSDASPSHPPNAKKAGQSDDASAVTIKGPKASVEQLCQSVEKLVAEWRRIETITSHRESFTVAKGYATRLVGSGGPASLAWIVKAVRAQHASGTLKVLPADKMFEKDLVATSGMLYLSAESTSGNNLDTIVISGPKSFVVAAKAVVLERYAKLLDTTEIAVNLFQEISSDARLMLEEMGGDLKGLVVRRLIGKEGKNLKRISDKHDVNVRFLHPKRDGDAVDDAAAAADDAAHTGDDVADRGAILIRGSKSTVPDAKKELLEFVQQEISRSYRVTFRFPRSAVSSVVGRAGARVNKLKDDFSVRIDLKDDYETDEIECVLLGSREDCFAVKDKILEAVHEQTNVETFEVQIPSYLHRMVIGSAGASIRKLIDAFGGPDKVRVNFPKGEDMTKNGVTVTTASELVPAVREKLEALVAEVIASSDRSSNTANASTDSISSSFERLHLVETGGIEEIVTVPKSDVPFLFGRSRDVAIELMRRHGVTLWIEDDADEAATRMTIVGSNEMSEAVASCAKDIRSRLRVSGSVALTDDVLALLREPGVTQERTLERLSDIVRRIRADTGVTAEFSTGVSTGQPGSTIVLRGEQRRITTATELAQRQLRDLEQFRHMDRMQVPPEYLAHLIGRSGQTISRITSESGAQIDIQRGKRPQEPATVVICAENQEAIDAARSAIDVLLSEQAVRLQRDAERRQQAASVAASRAAASAAASHTTMTSAPHQAARIDDAGFANTSVNGRAVGVPGYVPPGYSGRTSALAQSPAVKVASAISGASGNFAAHQVTRVFTAPAAKPDDHKWKSVVKRSGRSVPDASTMPDTNGSIDSASVSTALDAPSVPANAQVNDTVSSIAATSTSSSKKKKKNKKKKSVTVNGVDATANGIGGGDHDADDDVDDGVPVEIVSPVASVAPVVVQRAPSPVKQVSPTKSPVPAFVPAPVVAPVSQKASPPKASVAKSAPAPGPVSAYHGIDQVNDQMAVEEASDDGWTTVTTKRTKQASATASVSVTADQGELDTAAAPADASTAAKKKKKKKKKKKSATATTDKDDADDHDDDTVDA